MHVVRRGHLYLGLFLLPWAVLYGVTAFLFNHPTVFADQPAVSFDKSDTKGTGLEDLPTPQDQAAQVVAELNKREQVKAKDAKSYALVRPDDAKYSREFAFATASFETVKGEKQQISLLYDVAGGGGSIRSKTEEPAKPIEKAPFAVSGGSRPAGSRGDGGGQLQTRSASTEGVSIDGSIYKRFESAVLTILERTGLLKAKGDSSVDIVVTSVPELVFYIESDGRIWKASYNSQTGSVSGQPADTETKEPVSVRRFLTRLHLAHGYPSSPGARWGWAVVVDIMAFVMVFWGLSGLFMWWQIKATRLIGFVILLLSAASATVLGLGMYLVIAG